VTKLQLIFMELPIQDERDVLARIGQRFAVCTGPYFLLALILSKFGHDGMLRSLVALLMIAIPFLGGVIDWRWLKSSRKDATLSTV
jgi:hypothetical protein